LNEYDKIEKNDKKGYKIRLHIWVFLKSLEIPGQKVIKSDEKMTKKGYKIRLHIWVFLKSRYYAYLKSDKKWWKVTKSDKKSLKIRLYFGIFEKSSKIRLHFFRDFAHYLPINDQFLTLFDYKMNKIYF